VKTAPGTLKKAPEPPRAGVPGFEHLKRIWAGEHGRYAIRILPGEYYVTRDDEVISTVLGSCISACIRDRVAHCGGMNHFMLPVAGEFSKTDGLDTRFGTYAMERMINDLLKIGARKENLEVKVFGAGKVVASMTTTDIGKRNADFVRTFLRKENLATATEDMGGPWARKVHYFPDSGRVMLKRIENQSAGDIFSRELAPTARQVPVSGSVELF
jgi:chemotaxis protein CheD